MELQWQADLLPPTPTCTCTYEKTTGPHVLVTTERLLLLKGNI